MMMLAPVCRLLLVVSVCLPLGQAAPPAGPGNLVHRAESSPTRSWTWANAKDKLAQIVWKTGSETGAKKNTWTGPSEKLAGVLKSPRGDDVVLRFFVNGTAEAQSFDAACETLSLDIWERAPNWIDVRLAEKMVPSLLERLPECFQSAEKVSTLMHGRDLSRAVAGADVSIDDGARFQLRGHERHSHSTPPPKPNSRGSNAFFENYHPYTVIAPWMRLIQSVYNSHVTLVSVGTSFLGRDIAALRLGVHPTNDEAPRPRRKTVLVSAGLRARDWLSTATSTHVAYSIITSYGREPTVWTQLLHDFDWVFIPTLNVDGYEYSWETDRLWQKNRQPTPISLCRGVNLDRTWDSNWTAEAGNPCAESYSGKTPFRGHEAAQLARWAQDEIKENNVEFVGYLDLQGYSQQVLHSSSDRCVRERQDLAEVESLGRGLAAALTSRHSENYSYVASCSENTASFPLAANPGSALGWFHDVLGIKFAYQIKLRDLGERGFLAPSEHIVPSGQEVLRAVEHFGLALRNATVADDSLVRQPEQSSAPQTSRVDRADNLETHATDLKRRRRR